MYVIVLNSDYKLNKVFKTMVSNSKQRQIINI